MPFLDKRFDPIHQLLRRQNLTVMPGPFNSQADVLKAYRESAEIMTRTSRTKRATLSSVSLSTLDTFSNGSPSTSSEMVNPAEAVSGEKSRARRSTH